MHTLKTSLAMVVALGSYATLLPAADGVTTGTTPGMGSSTSTMGGTTAPPAPATPIQPVQPINPGTTSNGAFGSSTDTAVSPSGAQGPIRTVPSDSTITPGSTMDSNGTVNPGGGLNPNDWPPPNNPTGNEGVMQPGFPPSGGSTTGQ